MRKGIYLKAVVRQPIRSLLLLLLCAVAAFAFGNQALQSIALERAGDEISEFYRPVGYLDTGYDLAWGGIIMDVGELNEAIAASKHTSWVNGGRAAAGALLDFHNAYIHPGQTDLPQNFIYVIGTVQAVNSQIEPVEKEHPNYQQMTDHGWENIHYTALTRIIIRIDDIPAAMPDYIRDDLLTLNCYTLEEDDRIALEESLTQGSSYLFRVQVDGGVFSNNFFTSYLLHPLLNGSWVWPAEDLDLSDAALAADMEEIAILNEDYYAAPVFTATDMATTPYMESFLLYSGRLLTEEDCRTEAAVCVIQQDLASVRGLKLGDMLRIELRDYETWDTHIGKFMATPRSDDDGNELLWREVPTQTLELTIVGIVSNRYNSSSNNPSTIIIPDSLLDPNWSSPYWNAMCSFVLNSAEDLSPFLAEPEIQAAVDAANSGYDTAYAISFLENGWEAFREAFEPMLLSARFNTALFGGVSAVLLALAVLLYLLQRRRELSLQRALGVPRRSAAAQALLPMGVIAALGIALGAVLALRTGTAKAVETLASVQAEVPLTVAISYVDAAAFAGLLYLFTVAAAWLSLSVLSRQPVLALLQRGGAAQNKAVQTPQTVPQPVPQQTPRAQPQTPPPPAAPHSVSVAGRGSPGAGVLWRYLARHVLRTSGRSLMVAVAAAAFTVGLSYLSWSIQRNEERIDTLYNTVEIAGEIRQVSSLVLSEGGSIVYGSVIQKIVDTGFVADIRLEGIEEFYYYDEELGKGTPGGVTVDDENNVFHFCAVTNKPEGSWFERLGYFEEIEYLPGYSLEDIYAPLEEGEVPILLHESCMRVKNLSLGDVFTAEIRSGALVPCKIIGRTTKSPSAIMSLEAFQTYSLEPSMIKYSVVEFTLSPAVNRELDSFRETIEREIVMRRGRMPETTLVLDDSELRNAVEPLYRTNQLLRVLYPVAVGVSVLAAAGLALLLILQYAREMAIMRALGNPRRLVIAQMWAEQVLLCAAGLAVGLLAMGTLLRPDGALWRRSLLAAALYLAGCCIASVISAWTATKKNPLELLQVKE